MRTIAPPLGVSLGPGHFIHLSPAGLWAITPHPPGLCSSMASRQKRPALGSLRAMPRLPDWSRPCRRGPTRPPGRRPPSVCLLRAPRSAAGVEVNLHLMRESRLRTAARALPPHFPAPIQEAPDLLFCRNRGAQSVTLTLFAPDQQVAVRMARRLMKPGSRLASIEERPDPPDQANLHTFWDDVQRALHRTPSPRLRRPSFTTMRPDQ